MTIDIHGSRPDAPGDGDDSDLDAEDFLYEVGSGSVVPELDDQLRGAKAGDILAFDATLEALDQTVSFRVLVKDVKELVLPEVTDEWASEASEFDTADELTADVTERLRQRHIVQAQMALQQKTAEALVELVTEEIPEQLVAGGAPRADPRPQPPTRGPGDEPRPVPRPPPVATSRSSSTSCGPAPSRASRSTWPCGPWWRRRGSRSPTRSSTRSWPPWASAWRWTPTRYASSWNGPDGFRRYARTGARPRPCVGWSTTSSWSTRTGSRCHGTT